MKKLIFLAACCLTSVIMWAAKADPTPATITQSDGTTLTVIGHGDEDFHWYTTTDGVLLAHIGFDYFIANVEQDGTITATRQLAHEKALRSDAEARMVKSQDTKAFYSIADANKARMAAKRNISIGSASPAYFPHTGSPKALVILVDFTDTPFTVSDPKNVFNDYLNSQEPLKNYGNREDRNYRSVREYFNNMSNGQFTPVFDVYGPVTLPNTSAHYGAGSDNVNDLVTDACNAVDEEVDFAEYDQNQDGTADLVYIIYAGFSESISGNSSDCIWPKSGAHNFGKWDNVTVNRYGINNELNYYPDKELSAPPSRRVNGIGLFCHEFSHTLGLSDHYPTVASARLDNQAMEFWDLMDGGTYTDNGYTPTPYIPWEKEVMGWTEIEELTDAAHVELQPDEALKVVGENGEYVILHNVQGMNAYVNPETGAITYTAGLGWARSVLGHGLLVYRIDYNKSAVNIFDYPNDTAGKPGITIVPADSLLITSYRVYSKVSDKSDAKPYSQDEYIGSHYADPYPGMNGVTEIPYITLNNSKLEKPIYNIEEKNRVISFNFLEKEITGIEGIKDNTQKAGDDKIFTLDGRYAGKSVNNLRPGIYIRNKQKIAVQ